MKLGTAQTRATMRYKAKNYDSMLLQLPKGAKAELQSAAKAAGAKSTTAYLAGIIEAATGIKCTLDGEFPAKK